MGGSISSPQKSPEEEEDLWLKEQMAKDEANFVMQMMPRFYKYNQTITKEELEKTTHSWVAMLEDNNASRKKKSYLPSYLRHREEKEAESEETATPPDLKESCGASFFFADCYYARLLDVCPSSSTSSMLRSGTNFVKSAYTKSKKKCLRLTSFAFLFPSFYCCELY